MHISNLIRTTFLTIVLASTSLTQGFSSDTGLVEDPTWRDQPLSIRAQRIEIPSKITGRTYQIFVFVPSSPPPPEGYPVLYMLDGNASYPLAASQLEIALHTPRPGGLKQALMVGIGYQGDVVFDMAARTEDYTPPAKDLSNTGDPSGRKQGGADRFLDFIENELKPRIENDFAINKERQTLFGHSYGGLFTLHTLFTRPDAFQTYIAASPSVWWNRQYVLKEKDLWLENHSSDEPFPKLALGIGTLEFPENRIASSSERAKILAERAKGVSLKELSEELRSLGMPVDYYEFAENDHGTARVSMITHALRIAFQ
ncbi:alpha/beta hydrolase [Pelagicoccus albus]|nr:alpha/beta hydrolase-fold protein [Pelagicoccus albus]